jgi:putative copper resistance protein D
LTAALIAARAFHLTATAMLVGVVIFQCCVMTPALRETGDASLARAIERFAGAIVWLGLAAAIASGGAWLVLLTSNITGETIGDAISNNALNVLTETQFGRAIAARLFLAILIIFTLVRRSRWDRTGWIAVLLAVCFAGGLAWMGHSGAGEEFTGGVQVTADVLHVVAASAWLGGLIPLAYLFVLAVRPTSTALPVEIGDTTRRFSNLGVLSVATLLITGVVNTVFLIGSAGVLVGSRYGQLLMIKVALFLAMIGIAIVNRLQLTPRITATTHNVRTKALHRLARNSFLEASLGLAVLAIVAALGTLPPEMPTEHPMHISAGDGIVWHDPR